MHAYLIIGKQTTKNVETLVNKLGGLPYEFPISKIDEVRSLANFLKTTQTEKTVIVCHDIDIATIEALNAFLKNLEEPQKNVTFILTAKNEYKLLPTITSRCQLIRVSNSQLAFTDENADKFINSKTGERLLIIDKIKVRLEATVFLQNLIGQLHLQLNNDPKNYQLIAKYLEESQKTLSAIEANGNVNLQLTNLVVNLDAGQNQ